MLEHFCRASGDADAKSLPSSHFIAALPETAFIHTVEVAAQIFNVPFALVSLVDQQRHWCKAYYGAEIQHSEKFSSLAAYAYSVDGPLIVKDTQQDARFSQHPMLEGTHIRFFVALPLMTAAGQRLGTICILDTEPRASFTQSERAILQALADGIISEIQLLHVLAEQAGAEKIHAAILESSLEAIITMNDRGLVTEWNPAAEKLFDYRREDVLGQDLSTLIIPELYREAHKNGIERYLQTGEGPVLGKRIEVPALRRDGTTFPCELAITPLNLESTVLFTASLRDLTEPHAAREELAASHALLRTVVDTVQEAMFVKDLQGRYIMINTAGARITGKSVEEIIGFTDEEIYSSDASLSAQEFDHTVLKTGQALTYETTLLLPTGIRRTYWITKVPTRNHEGEVTGLVGAAIDITERQATEMTVRKHNEQLTARVQSAQLEVLRRLAHAAEYRDDNTGEHMSRVALTAANLARELGLHEDTVRLIEQTAPLHDVGKIGISDTLLQKPGRLTPEEFETIKTHTTIGANILAGGQSPLVQMAELIARTHHERWDGHGYPRGLAGEDIPIVGRIVAVADVLDALTSARPYKQAWPLEDALVEIRAQAGHHFDPQVVAALERLMSHRSSD